MNMIFSLFSILSSVQAFRWPSNVTTYETAIFTKIVSELVVKQLSSSIIKSGRLLNNLPLNAKQNSLINITIPFKELPEPITLPSIEFSLELPNMFGNVSTCSPEILGQSGLKGKVALLYDPENTNVTTIILDIQLPSIHIDSNYLLDIATEFNGNGLSITGEGKLSIGFTSFFFKLMAIGDVPFIPGKTLSLNLFDVDIGFKDLFTNIEGGFLNDTPLGLRVLASIIKYFFYHLWTDSNKRYINEAIRCSIDNLINECQPSDFITGALECLKLKPNPACFKQSDEATIPVLNLKFLSSTLKLQS